MAENERDVGEEEAKLRLTIKTTKRKETVEISGDATVKQVRLVKIHTQSLRLKHVKLTTLYHSYCSLYLNPCDSAYNNLIKFVGYT